MSSPNRKRSKITLETKKKIIDVSANQNSTELGKQFELPPSTIRRILQNKRSILNALEQGNEAKRIVLRPVKHVNIDEAVLLWVKTLRTNGISLNGPLLKEKAWNWLISLESRILKHRMDGSTNLNIDTPLFSKASREKLVLLILEN
ncbi:hypothetical protein ACQ4LE_010486 [Meloidogyne hapla]